MTVNGMHMPCAGILASKTEEVAGAQGLLVGSSNVHTAPLQTAPSLGLSITTSQGLNFPPATTPGPRASTLKPFQGAVASLPEAAGLPYDEGYAYLCLLRRYILYGPTMGLATSPAVARQPGMSTTGAAVAASVPGALSSNSSQVNI